MSDAPAAEERLVERARSGDRSAQQELWRAHRRWIAAIVLAHRPRSIDVDDAMQDVAVKFVSRIQTLRDPRAFRPWLRQIVINICRGASRSERPELHLVDEPAQGDERRNGRVSVPASGEPTSAELLAARDDARRLLQQALTLPPEYREPLLLRCVQSMSYQQISETLNLPVTTIETRLARARRMLREEIGEELMAEEYV